MTERSVEEFLKSKFITDRPDNPNEEVYRAIFSLYREYAEWGLKDNKFETDFTDGTAEHFYPYLWEMILAKYLKKLGLKISSQDEGPDFKIPYEGQTIWVEAVCPLPNGIDDYWLKGSYIENKAEVHAVPIVERTLRWTTVVKTKMEKRLLVDPEHKKHPKGWVPRKIIPENDPYVIAVSSCQLGNFPPKLRDEGISGFPFAAEMAFGIGPKRIIVDRKTGEAKSELSTQDFIKNDNGADVPTNIFLLPEYSGVSAILASSAGVNEACGDQVQIVIVHNPNADNPLPKQMFGVHEEISAIQNKKGNIEITRTPQ